MLIQYTPFYFGEGHLPPLLSSISTISPCPFIHAKWSGVRSLWSNGSMYCESQTEKYSSNARIVPEIKAGDIYKGGWYVNELEIVVSSGRRNQSIARSLT